VELLVKRGDPGTIRSVADTLAAEGDQLTALARTLRGLADPDIATWESPAGAAFGQRARLVASVLDSVGRRYAVSAAALRPLATALVEAQSETASARRLREEHWDPFVKIGNRWSEASSSHDPAEQAGAPVLHAQMVAEGEVVAEAERRHASALERFRDADRRCAAVLRSLQDDGLADTRTYDALTGLSRGAGAVSGALGTVSWIPSPPTKALAAVQAAADATQLGSDLVVKVAYGDGEWATIGLTAAAAAAGQVSPVLKRAAKQTTAEAAKAAATRAERRALRLGTADRLRLGLVEQARRGFRKDPNPLPRKVEWTSPPAGLAAKGVWAGEQARVRAKAYAQNRWLDDFARVTGQAGTAPRLYLAGIGVDVTRDGLGAAGTVVGKVDQRRDEAAMTARDRAAPDEAGLAQATLTGR
jgi:hypothetical protein